MSRPTIPRPASVRVVFRKWPDSPHWEHDAVLLGSDEHGSWLGAAAGTLMRRPGVEYPSERPQVLLVPESRPFVASFYEAGGPVDVYVDISTPAAWTAGTVTAVDLDLDVVRGWTGRTWVDDEDEFAEHQVGLGYPDDLVLLATRSCEQQHAAVSSGAPPYDGTTSRHWLDRLEEVTSRG